MARDNLQLVKLNACPLCSDSTVMESWQAQCYGAGQLHGLSLQREVVRKPTSSILIKH